MCYCFDNPKRKLDESICNKTCAGHSSFKCGSSSQYYIKSVYGTGRETFDVLSSPVPKPKSPRPSPNPVKPRSQSVPWGLGLTLQSYGPPTPQGGHPQVNRTMNFEP